MLIVVDNQVSSVNLFRLEWTARFGYRYFESGRVNLVFRMSGNEHERL